MISFDEKKQDERLEELHKKEEEDLVKILSDRYDVPSIDLSTVSINGDALKLIPEGTAREAGAAAFSLQGKKVSLAVLSPKKDSLKEILDSLQRTGYVVQMYMASNASLQKAWKTYSEVSFATETEAGVFDISRKDIAKFMEQIGNLEGLTTLLSETLESSARYKISRILEVIVAGAIALSASDIHIEPGEDEVRLRFRLDGVLHDLLSFKHETYKFLLSRIKLLSELKLNIKEDAQDGRFSIKLDIGEIEIRTSVLPGEYGESIVLRILNPQSITVPFESLGIEDELFAVLKKEISRPNGMILTTGPTGSGKTTTLYSILRKIYSTEIKIITIEDPIEYHLAGISQTQINEEKGYTFLQGLRSALRQDPDVIMVGEIRDSETAGVAVNSALTGHLVLSTLHTNNSAGVIPRLIDLGVNPKIISSALNLSLAQRLVRKLCDTCKEEYTPEEKEVLLLNTIIASIQKKRTVTLDTSRLWRAHIDTKNPCATCAGLGYKGRIGIFEGIFTDTAVEEVIVTFNPSEREIKKAAEGQNLLDMKEDGVLKVLRGTTTLEELRRVIDLEE